MSIVVSMIGAARHLAAPGTKKSAIDCTGAVVNAREGASASGDLRGSNPFLGIGSSASRGGRLNWAASAAAWRKR
jgi:hypothetical protein